MKESAVVIQEMLASRHSGDVFVAECKDGPTQTRAHRRLDAWVLLKTWSPITTIGYEIKVSVSDWRRDAKMHDYMPLCHLLYVVAPKGIVPPEELPSGVGLIEPVGEAGRLQVKRKAARREIALPGELMVYVLMCRTKITRDVHQHPEDRNWRIEELKRWVAGKEERRELSYAVSARIRAAFDSQQQQLEIERRRNDDLVAIRDRIVELGFDPAGHVNQWSVRERLNRFNLAVDSSTLHHMRHAAKMLTQAANDLERLKTGAVDSEEVL